MSARALLLGLMWLVTLPALADAASDTAAGARLRSAIGGLKSLRADFEQTVTDAKGKVLERAEGTMSLSRPGRFRWDYRVPAQLIVSDGRTVWIHDVDLEQVTVRQAADALQGTPAKLLLDGGDLDSEFTVRDGGRADGLDWSILTPRATGGDFRELRLALERGEMRRLQLLDRLGQTTEIRFSKVERNPRLEASSFKFIPPPGVDIVGQAPSG